LVHVILLSRLAVMLQALLYEGLKDLLDFTKLPQPSSMSDLQFTSGMRDS
jgi:hypothetical protein